MTLMLALLITSLIILLITRIAGLSVRCSELGSRADKYCAELEKLQQSFDGQLLSRTAAVQKVNEDFLYEIQQRIKSEEELVRRNELFQFIISAAPFVVWAMDADGVLLLSGGKGLAALGLRQAEVAGKPLFDLYGDEQQVLNNCRRALAGEALKAFVEISGRRYACWYCPVPDAHGKVTKVVGFAIETEELAEERLPLIA